MLDTFLDNIRKEHLVSKGQKVLLAVSGGRDSVVMTHLFSRTDISFGIAHCNFGLRPGDCDEDESFVKNLAGKIGVECYVAKFDTRGYAEQEHLSIEEAARRQRYNFFFTLCAEHGYDCVATAHHRDDSIETFFINLLRGTGISGLHGIPMKNGKIIRPLLPFGRDQIDAYVKKEGLAYKDDYTNFRPLYLRNKIRLNLIPLLREISPSFDKVMRSNMENIRSAESLYDYAVNKLMSSVVIERDDRGMSIDRSKLEQLASMREPLMFEMLREYGFTSSVVNDIVTSLSSTEEQVFLSPTHRLIKERYRLVVEPMEEFDDVICDDEIVLDVGVEECNYPIHLRFAFIEKKSTEIILPRHQCWLDYDKLHKPLHLRRWRAGDSFVPYGMRSKKLLSDFFKDSKFTRRQKENQWLLCDADDNILWVIGHRASAMCCVDDATKTILSAEVDT